MLRKSSHAPPLQAGAKVLAFSSDIDNGGVSHLIKDSYIFNSLCVAPCQHRQGAITLFIGPCCCRVNNVCYKERHYHAIAGSRVWRLMEVARTASTLTCMPAHIQPTLLSSVQRICTFREHSLLPILLFRSFCLLRGLCSASVKSFYS